MSNPNPYDRIRGIRKHLIDLSTEALDLAGQVQQLHADLTAFEHDHGDTQLIEALREELEAERQRTNKLRRAYAEVNEELWTYRKNEQERQITEREQAAGVSDQKQPGKKRRRTTKGPAGPDAPSVLSFAEYQEMFPNERQFPNAEKLCKLFQELVHEQEMDPHVISSYYTERGYKLSRNTVKGMASKTARQLHKSESGYYHGPVSDLRAKEMLALLHRDSRKRGEKSLGSTVLRGVLDDGRTASEQERQNRSANGNDARTNPHQQAQQPHAPNQGTD